MPRNAISRSIIVANLASQEPATCVSPVCTLWIAHKKARRNWRALRKPIREHSAGVLQKQPPPGRSRTYNAGAPGGDCPAERYLNGR